jgi:ABC-type nitrate/sulfonate/bicarbonate transport system permease component
MPQPTSGRFLRLLRLIVLPLALLAVWEALARAGLINTISLPAPSRVWSGAMSSVGSGELLNNTAASLMRIALAILAATAIAVPLGIAMGLSRAFEEVMDGLVNLLRPIPPLAWIPLSILWFGLGEVSVVFITGISAFFALLLNTIAGVRGVERSLLRAAQSLGAKKWTLIFRVVLPGCLAQHVHRPAHRAWRFLDEHRGGRADRLVERTRLHDQLLPRVATAPISSSSACW